MNLSFLRLAALALLSAGVVACVSTLPSAEQLDAYEKAARAEYQAAYAELESQRGQMTPEQYAAEREALDQRVRTAADTKAWGRHALAESELRAQGIPTPEQPV
ncbi:MAG TPA: hypothetical protein VD994_05400, partial [Prosthecobacter sp.]|nr:hypothetical protein [Prosthecobacter sp.]